MTRSDLITEIAVNAPHLRQADVELIVATIFGHITDALARGQRVELRGFGSFGTKQRNARTGRNPRTGAEVPIAAKAVPYFRTSPEMIGRLNRST
jgi:integration host factor subunit beta